MLCRWRLERFASYTSTRIIAVVRSLASAFRRGQDGVHLTFIVHHVLFLLRKIDMSASLGRTSPWRTLTLILMFRATQPVYQQPLAPSTTDATLHP